MRSERTNQAARWARLLTQWAEIGGAVVVVPLEDVAVDFYTGDVLGRHKPRKPGGPPIIVRKPAAMARRTREIDEATKGQPFRMDTPAGTFFVWDALVGFANIPALSEPPRWGGDYRPSPEALRHAEEVI